MIQNKAISKNEEPLVLYAGQEYGYSLMASTTETDYLKFRFEIESSTLSSFLKEYNLDKLDFVKIDCEGSEYPILYSWTKDDFSKIDRLVVESHPMTDVDYNHDSLVNYLKKQEYNVSDSREGEGTGYIWAWR